MSISFDDLQYLTFCQAGSSWQESVNIGEKIALIHSELSELLEAHRNDPKEPCDKPGVDLTCEEEEMADVFLRLLQLAQYRGIDLMEVGRRKHEYNRTRPPKHNGKRF